MALTSEQLAVNPEVPYPFRTSSWLDWILELGDTLYLKVEQRYRLEPDEGRDAGRSAAFQTQASIALPWELRCKCSPGMVVWQCEV